MAIPKSLWSYQIASVGTDDTIYSSIPVSKVIESIFGDNPTGRGVVSNFVDYILHKSPYIGTFGALQESLNSSWLSLSYATIFVILVILTFVLMRLYQKKWDRTSIIQMVWLWISIIIYVFGILCVYLTNFTGETVSRLMGLNRYILLPYLSVMITIIYLAFLIADKSEKRNVRIAIYCGVVIVVLYIAPMKYMGSWLMRGEAKMSQERREPYEGIISDIENNCSEDDSILLIDQEDWSYPSITIKFASLPLKINYFNDSNYALNWETLKVLELYSDISQRDYVAVLNADENLAEIFSTILDDSTTFKEDCLYRMDHNRQCLVPCAREVVSHE